MFFRFLRPFFVFLSRSPKPRPLSLSFFHFVLPSFPFLLVDRVVELVPQKYAVGYKVRLEGFFFTKKGRERKEGRSNPKNSKTLKKWKNNRT